MRVVLATCPNPECRKDQEATVVSLCVICTPPHADVLCNFCGQRWAEFNPVIYERDTKPA